MDQKSMREIITKGYKFEDVIKEIFEYSGYKIIKENIAINRKEVDLIIERESEKYILEIKYSTRSIIGGATLLNVWQKLNDFDKGEYKDYKPMIVISSILDDKSDKILRQKEPSILIIDIKNLLYMVRNNRILKSKVLELLDYSTNEIIEEKPNISIDETVKFNIENDPQKLIEELKLISSGKRNFSKYEAHCIKILQYLFEKELGIWRKQCQSNAELYRFDLVCKIKMGVLTEFWETIRHFFNSKYIVFEFKNYTNLITQKEIYTTEKYLYIKSLRSVAIIISRQGIDSNGIKAIKGTLREHGKLILALNDNDLINMIKCKENDDEPSDYLAEKLDEMLLELEK